MSVRAKAALLIVTVALLSTSGAYGAPTRFHGTPVDSQHDVILEQMNNEVIVNLLRRSRPQGEEVLKHGDLLSEPGTGGRFTKSEPMLHVRAEVLKSSAPNYLQNPGEVYRITVRGEGLLPGYQQETVVPAELARDVVIGEFGRFWSRASGVYRDALIKAIPLTLQALVNSGHLPSEIMESVMQSRSGRFRITPGSLQRRPIVPLETFAPKIQIGQLEAGASVEALELEALPEGAVSPEEVRGISAPLGQVRPRTPAAGGVARAGAAQQSEAVATGRMGRTVTWAPVGAGIGEFPPEIRISQDIGNTVR